MNGLPPGTCARVPALDRDAEAAAPAGHRALGQAGASALMIASMISWPQWLVAKVTGAPGLAQTTVPGLAMTVIGRKVPSFFGVCGSIR